MRSWTTAISFGLPADRPRDVRSSCFSPVMRISKFTFNPFQENTYVVDDGRHALIIDPGCWDPEEQQELAQHITGHGLTPVQLVLTHAHIDHVLGCAWVEREYGLRPEMHAASRPLLEALPAQAAMFGIPMEPVPAPQRFLDTSDTVRIGERELGILYVPGHAPGHIALFDRVGRWVIAGDTLFQGSIGRTDLPGGDTDLLLRSIREQLYPLGDDVTVYSGHGPETTIGRERKTNPFVKG